MRLKLNCQHFVAASLKRIPSVIASDADVRVHTVNMMQMKDQLKMMAVEQKRLSYAVAIICCCSKECWITSSGELCVMCNRLL